MAAAPPVAAPHGSPSPPSPWPRTAQLATMFLLGVTTTLLAVHCWRGLRWDCQPTELERGVLLLTPLDLNRAEQAELLQVPGIGPRTAEQIERYRTQNGAFQNVTDLRQIPGIGPTMLERFRPWFFVKPAASGSPKEATRASPERQPTPSTSKKASALTEPLDLNEATITELQRLPTVGPKRAQMIAEERHKRPFASVEELRRVPGIGVKTLERLRPYVTVQNSAARLFTKSAP